MALPPDRLEAAHRALVERFGPDRVLTDFRDRMAYAYDATGIKYPPDVVVFPLSTEDAADAVRIAAHHGLPIVARGGGTNISGGTVPIRGGLCLALNRMDRILDIDPENHTATVQPGVRNLALQEALKPHGFFFAPDPSSHRVSTIGGNAGENAGGPHCLKYGVTVNHVLGLTLVLADGSVVRLGGPEQDRPGYDLVSLLVGSEGTLGIITELVVRILPLPAEVRTLLAVFDDLEVAMRTVSDIIAARVVPATMELLDRGTIEVVERFARAGYPEDAEAVLLIEVDGPQESVAEELDRVEAICRRNGARDLRIAQSEAEREALWLGRRAAYGAAGRLSAYVWTQDVTVPRDRLVEMLRACQAIGRKYGIRIISVAHAGDGNLHPLVAYDPQDADQVRRVKAADREILEACVALGGSISGEHGIGHDKLPNLELQLGPDLLGLMWSVRRAFDPDLRLNPGKAVAAPSRNV
ncbi:MAG: FAD-linked oxidase C-terminal domain-containing protein [Thermaerobacter sp.]|nr:MAG: FAD-binding oxidoreductase [Bacillota bacterium]